MKRVIVALLLAIGAVTTAFFATDAAEQATAQAREAVQREAGEAWLAECRARTPVVVTLNGQEWDLSACG
jgi:hypothetical protein